MAAIKSFTDIPQSKKLAEILPLESADKHWIILDVAILRATTHDYFDLQEYNQDKGTFREYVPSWSLAALLDILPDGTDIVKDKSDTENEKYMCTVGVKDDIISTFGNNPVDACVDMIESLHEQKIL